MNDLELIVDSPGTPYLWVRISLFNDCIENEWLWSIATDFNPNCRTLSLPFIASVLVQRNEISPITTLAACTRNSSETTLIPLIEAGQIVEGEYN